MKKWAVALVGMAIAAGLAAGEAPTNKTLDNLQAAYNGESNAKAKYDGYAKKAEAEGYMGAAALFRAASRAEGIHAEAHAVVIKKLGAVPMADIKAPVPKSTKENLEDALKGETYEKDTMYPDFIEVARGEGNKDALQSFTYAKSAERGHADLYTEALKDIGAWKSAKSFWVCTVCGCTLSKITMEKCPSCFNPKDRFVEVKLPSNNDVVGA